MIAGYATLERQVAALARDFRVLRQAEDAIATTRRTALDLAGDLGFALDPWQRAAVTTDMRDILLLVTRQGGKGQTAALIALDGLLNDPGSTTVIVSRADRQAKRLMRRIKKFYRSLPNTPPAVVDSQFALELRTGSEILAVPGSEETIRGIEAVDLLIVDEGALVPDALFAAVYPMLATTNGRCVAMSTARGKRGWFWNEWEHGGDVWHRAKVTAPEIARIDPAWLERTRRKLGDWMYRQEFLCEFLDTEDTVFSHDLVMSLLRSPAQPLFPERGSWSHAA